ncbi:MAG TPA: aminomethyltransferase family protein [Myxococcaceae bacterium]|nr:aminomethyltransferase family protein [Myxococcaceae bacterium]
MEPLALHDIHQRAGATFGELNGREVVLRFGEENAYPAARSAVVLADLSSRQLLRITGEDRASFLHGMCTNDVKGLPEGTATYAAMLTPKGAMVCDARIWRRADDLLLDFEPGLGTKAKEFLEKYLISEDAELHDDSAGYGLLGVYGPKAGALLRQALGLSAAPERNRFVPVPFMPAPGSEAQTVLAVGADLVVPGGVELLVPHGVLAALHQRLTELGGPLGLRPIGFEALEVLRVEAGVPRYGQDMEDKTIPLEANLERAIHYNKGCYIGQEVIARATFRGHMNRKLTGLLLGEQQPAPQAELRSGEKKVGWITSVVRSPAKGQNVALGYVHRDFLQPGTKLQVVGHGEAEVQPLPFVG